MMFFKTEKYGNPHSRTHMFGWEIEDYVEEARNEIASLIGSDKKEIIFTSGATESNNMAIKGIAKFYKRKKHIITTQIEHKCVLDNCRYLTDEGFEITYLPVKMNGLIDLGVLRSLIKDDTLIISIMYVNNEIGVIQPIESIGHLCKKRGVFFHTDAAQGLGKIPIDVNKMNIDLMSLSAHKIYGPKGIGALYIRRRPKVRIYPILNGGGQERGLRSGTIPAPLVIGFGKACEIASNYLEEDMEHVTKLYNRLLNGIQEKLEDVYINGDPNERYKGNLNLSFAYVEGESLLMGLKHVAVSSGSACTSASLEPSYVLRAIGVGDELAHTSIRYGISRFTTNIEIDYAIKQTVFNVKRLRELSPLWEMKKEGIDLKSIEWC